MIENLTLGLSVAVSAENLLWCVLGTVLGTVVGTLPGLGPLGAISILLPLVYEISSPITSLIFLAGIYYGTQYGGSTASILLKFPGESSSLVTIIDGYPMAAAGRAGSALAIAALASFVAGTIATLLIAAVSEPLAEIAFMFGPAEYATLLLLGLIACVSLSQGSFLLGISMVLLGMLLGSIGTDVNSGTIRFSFGNEYLADGISFVILAVGFIGLAEMLYSACHGPTTQGTVSKPKNFYPSKKEIKQAFPAALRGTAIGSVLGMIPGAGPILSSFMAYAAEKKLSKKPHTFGNGAPEGVAAPEAANNAAAQTSFIPMLSLGLPITPVMSLMIAAMMINNLQPGPQIISTYPSLFWGLIISMWIGNLMLVILNLPMIGLWIKLLQISKWLLYPLILVVSVVSVYSIGNHWFNVILLFVFAILGYGFKLLKCEPAPLVMGFVIGGMFEEHLRRFVHISRGDWTLLLDRPLSLSFLIITGLVLISGMAFNLLRQRRLTNKSLDHTIVEH